MTKCETLKYRTTRTAPDPSAAAADLGVAAKRPGWCRPAGRWFLFFGYHGCREAPPMATQMASLQDALWLEGGSCPNRGAVSVRKRLEAKW